MITDNRLMLGFPNQTDRAVLGGGSWRAALPLTNLQTRLLARVARSADATPGSTRFTVDFGRPERLQIVAFVAHNLTLRSKVRIRAWRSGVGVGSPAYDVLTDVWGGLLTAEWNIDELEWEDDNFWLGTFSQDDIRGLTATSTHVLGRSVAARYWQIEFFDEDNPDDYVQIGRTFFGPGLRPSLNYAPGAGLGYETLTEVVTALGGAEFFDVREPTRVFRFTINAMSDAEGFGQFLEMVRKAGIHGEVFVVPDPSDSFYGLLRNFVGRLKQLNPLEQAMYSGGRSYHSMAFEIKELR